MNSSFIISRPAGKGCGQHTTETVDNVEKLVKYMTQQPRSQSLAK